MKERDRIEEILSDKSSMDTETLEKISSSCNVLSEEQKNRIFGIIMEKESGEKADKENTDENEIRAKIIEYKGKNNIKIIAAIAACACIVTGLTALLARNNENINVGNDRAEVTTVSVTAEEPAVSDSENQETKPYVTAVSEKAERNTEIETVTSVVTVTGEEETVVTENKAAVSEAQTEPVTENKAEPDYKTESLNGCWKNDAEYPDTLVFDNGKFWLISGYSKILIEGNVKMESSSDSEGNKKYNWVLYDSADNSVMDTLPVTDNQNILNSSESGNFTRDESVSRIPSSGMEFTGDEWDSYKLLINVTNNEDNYEVTVFWSRGYNENTEVIYNCRFDSAAGSLVADGNGVRTDITTDDSGETKNIVYTDGSAEFTMRYGVLFYNDHKDDMGRGYAFLQ